MDDDDNKKTTLTIRANETGSAKAPPLATTFVKLTGARRVEPGATARDGSAAAAPLATDEVVRVEYSNGSALWVRADDLLIERGRQVTARDGGAPVWEIDSAASAAAERGVTALAIKALEFFGVDVAGAAAGEIASRFELHQLKGNAPGLYRCALDGQPLKATATVPAGQRVLLFLHGTMSSFRGSFGALEESAARDALLPAYGANIFAFEHRTLTQSPIENALDLVAQLPAGAELDIVSHSRGGLVGELLCLAERDRTQDGADALPVAELFAKDRTIASSLGLADLGGTEAKARDAAYAADAKRLVQLIRQLDAKRIRVRRFVRVACPARGTTLASGRLDRWLSVLDAAAGNSLFAEMADFVLAVVKKRTDPRTLPGVEAMMPGSALTRLLQQPSLVTRSDLSVIAGDTEGQGAWGSIKTLVTDWFYGTEHDLVVNTGSMSGGLARAEGRARWLLDRGSEVSHFRYFTNAGSLRWMVAGLVRADGDSAGFLPIEKADTTPPPSRAAMQRSRDATTPRPIVVVVPGTMGSALALAEREVWLSYWRLLRGGLADIGWGAKAVKPVELLENFYGPLLTHLAATHRVEVFPYDWRLSVRDCAKALADKLEALLPEARRTKQPLHIVAHSMGGLVARSMIADGGRGAAVWKAMGELPASRLLMLGTPNRGSHEAVRWLAGCNPTEAKLALLDLTHDVAGIIDIVRRYPGMAELLPSDDDSFADTRTWRALHDQKVLDARFPLVEQSVLDDATVTWKRLRGATIDRERMRYVAGCADITVTGYAVERPAGLPLPPRLVWTATHEGDGTVSWASGRLEGVPTWYAPDTAHDELCSNSDDHRIFRAYVDILASGRTDQLPASAPAVKRDAAGQTLVFRLPERPPADALPDEAAVRSLAFSGAPRRLRRAVQATPTVSVSIRHVDLSYASHPVLVGHYAGDTIVSAEAALDKRLGRALSIRRDLGLYPGPSGTHAVFFNDHADRKPQAAIVVGLGTVGDLSAGRLQADSCDAMIEFALREAQRGDGDTRVSARLSCLLVGAGGAGLDVRESVEALLRAAVGANRRLEGATQDRRVLIEAIEFIELYEDVAIGAAQALAVVVDGSDLRESLRWLPRVVQEGPGRRKRRHYDSDRSWDQRIEIVEKKGQLRFTVATNRARAEETLATGQLALAEAFVQDAVTNTANDERVAQTLFEMLLPPGFKESAPDQRSMVLLLDRRSARFPWELMQDRWSRNGRPLAIEAGIVRQFKTDQFRAKPAQAQEFRALVVGNPDLGPSALFPDLPGARAEAQLVHQLLKGSKAVLDVKALVDEKAPAIVGALHEQPWRVLHLAGHGEHDWRPTPKAEPRSGMVIGDGVFLTSGDVAQMRWVPELVFVNCCHLGKTEGGSSTKAYHHLAANLGAEFIEMGVRAVVAAGWAVDDAAASCFARSFYQVLLDGGTFRDAVRQARERTLSDHPNANTWGAYQCYGDPSWRLVRDGSGGGETTPPRFFAPAELVAELDNLAEWARVQVRERSVPDSAVAERQRADVGQLLDRVPAEQKDGWLARADVAASIGFAYLQARAEDEAIDWLGRATASAAGDCPLRAIEQRANLLAVRNARVLRDAATKGPRRRTLEDEIGGAIAELDFLAGRAPTAERHGILGSAWKRLAWSGGTSGRGAALLASAAHYAKAVDIAGGDNAWALTNWAAVVLLGSRADGTPPLGAAPAARLRALVQAQAARSAANEVDDDVWSVTAVGDLALVQILLDADDTAAVTRHQVRAVAAYTRATAMGSSARELASMREQVVFMADLAQPFGAAAMQALKAVDAAFDA